MTKTHILQPIEVKSLRCIADGVYVLSFDRPFDFLAGQVVAIDLECHGQPRLYSIASGEKEDTLEILFDEKPDGKLSPLLSHLQAGDTCYISKPFGQFRTTKEKAFWIAAGTGVAPFVAMARSGLGTNKTLIHGGRFDENFYFQPLLHQLIGDNYVRCCSLQDDTNYYKGRLTQWLLEQTDLPKNCPYYLCGNDVMVVQVRDILISKGISFQNIFSETYF